MSLGLVLAAVFAIGASAVCLWLTETHERGLWPWPAPKPLTFDQALRQMAESMQATMTALGEALVPAMQQIAATFDGFARQVNAATIRDCLVCGRARRLGGPLARCGRHIDLPVPPSLVDPSSTKEHR